MDVIRFTRGATHPFKGFDSPGASFLALESLWVHADADFVSLQHQRSQCPGG